MQPNKPTGPVMDIQRPSPQPVSPPRPQMPTVDGIAGQKPASQLTRPATREYTRPRPQDPSAPSFTPPVDPARNNPIANQPPVKPKKSKKGLLITLVVLLALGVAGGATGYYMLVVNKEEPAVIEQQPAQVIAPQEEAKVEATPEGVDKATEEIDTSLNSLNDDTDFPSDQITDSTLGL